MAAVLQVRQVMLYPSLPPSHLVASSLMVSAKCLDGNRKEMHRLGLVKLISYWRG